MKKFFCLIVSLLTVISMYGNFDMKISNVGITSFHITVTPDSDNVYYVAHYMTLEEWDNGGITLKSLGRELQIFSLNVMSQYDYTYELMSDIFLEHGCVSCKVDYLFPNTEYVVYTCGVDQHTWEIITSFDTVHVTTLPGIISNNIIDLSFDGKFINIDCTNDDRYYFVIESEEEYFLFNSGLSQKALKNAIWQWYYSWINGNSEDTRDQYFVKRGSTSVDIRKIYDDVFGVIPKGRYIIYVAGFVEDDVNAPYISTETVSYLQVYLSEVQTMEDISDISDENQHQKCFENGQIVIYQKDGTKYNIYGLKILVDSAFGVPR